SSARRPLGISLRTVYPFSSLRKVMRSTVPSRTACLSLIAASGASSVCPPFRRRANPFLPSPPCRLLQATPPPCAVRLPPNALTSPARPTPEGPINGPQSLHDGQHPGRRRVHRPTNGAYARLGLRVRARVAVAGRRFDYRSFGHSHDADRELASPMENYSSG